MKLSHLLSSFVVMLATATAHGQTPLTLDDVVRLAQAQGNSTKSAHQSLEASRWQSQSFSAGLRPQLALNGSALNFNRSILPITGPNGETQYVGQAENQSQLLLQVSQLVPQTGGTFTVSSGLSRIDLFGNQTSQSWQTTPLVVGFRQSVFGLNATRWDEQRQSLTLSVAERQYIEGREDAASAAVAAFFDFLTSDIDLRNQLANAAINDTVSTINKLKYERGAITEVDVLQADLALLNARQAADAARLTNAHAEAALRRLLNLTGTEPLSVVAPTLLTLEKVDPDVAVKAALENGSLKEQAELQSVQARRQIEEARVNARFNATVSATLGFNQTAPGFLGAYQSPLGTQQLGVSVSMPLLQGGAGKANVEASRATFAQTETVAREQRAELADTARFDALGFMQSRSGLSIAAKADSVAARRFELAVAQYERGISTLTDLLQAQRDKDAAVLSSAQALRAYWVSYYQLRRVTLFDFVGNKPIQE